MTMNRRLPPPPAPPNRDYNNFIPHAHQAYDSQTTSESNSILYTGILIFLAVLFVPQAFGKPVAKAIAYLTDKSWDVLVTAAPTRLLLGSGKQIRDDVVTSGTLHSRKSEALTNVLGLNKTTTRNPFAAMLRKRADAPAGLPNPSTACFQNSVLQALASIPEFENYLDRVVTHSDSAAPIATSRVLLKLLRDLNSYETHGQTLRVPSDIRSVLPVLDEEDAHEFFTCLMSKVDDNGANLLKQVFHTAGLLQVPKFDEKEKVKSTPNQVSEYELSKESLIDTRGLRNPGEYTLAQRIGCRQCSYCEGLSLINSDHLQLQLPRSETPTHLGIAMYDALKLEIVEGVNCPKCTLLQRKTFYTGQFLKKPIPAMRDIYVRCYRSVARALKEADYSKEVVVGGCQIPEKSWAKSNKTKQAIFARSPQVLVMHVNRHLVTDTGDLVKNNAALWVDAILDLSQYSLGGKSASNSQDIYDNADSLQKQGECIMNPDVSMLDVATGENPMILYRLKSMIVHYGVLDGGHYISFRRQAFEPSALESKEAATRAPAPTNDRCRIVTVAHRCASCGEPSISLSSRIPSPSLRTEVESERWWRCDDERVTPMPEEHVLNSFANNVYMLFYEKYELLPGEASINCTRCLPVYDDVSSSSPSSLSTTGSEVSVNDSTDRETAMDTLDHPRSNISEPQTTTDTLDQKDEPFATTYPSPTSLFDDDEPGGQPSGSNTPEPGTATDTLDQQDGPLTTTSATPNSLFDGDKPGCQPSGNNTPEYYRTLEREANDFRLLTLSSMNDSGPGMGDTEMCNANDTEMSGISDECIDPRLLEVVGNVFDEGKDSGTGIVQDASTAKINGFDQVQSKYVNPRKRSYDPQSEDDERVYKQTRRENVDKN